MQNLFFDLENKNIAVGVSGGGDSMGLIHMLKKWNKAKKIIALTVDHGLRKESSLEASKVKSWMNDIKVEHHTLVWEKDFEIKTRIQELSRIARYKIIADFCLSNGIKYFLTAHHANDLIETFFMRLKRGSTIKGLCSMSRVKKTNFGYIIRPLINILKKDIMNCENHINDPSNDNLFFERVRVREQLKKLEPECCNNIVKSITHLNSAKNFIEHEVEKAMQACFKKKLLVISSFFDLQDFLAKEVLKNIIKNIGNSEYFISPKTIDFLFNKIKLSDFKSITAGNCLIKKINKVFIYIAKEQRKP